MDAKATFNKKALTEALMITARHAVAAPDSVTIEMGVAVADIRGYGGAGHMVQVMDLTNPQQRVPAYQISDRALAEALELEFRTAVLHYSALPRKIIIENRPTDNVARVPIPSTHSTHPLDIAGLAVGIDQESIDRMTVPDLPSLMRDPKKLGEFLATSVATMQEVPKMRAQLDDANKRADLAAQVSTAATKLAEERAGAITDLEARLRDTLTKVSTGAVATPNPAGKGNDLALLAKNMHITEAALREELASFIGTCALPLSNPVRWPAWCDPSDRSSQLPFCYKHSKPVFLAGESGTGKTFIAEALCMLQAGRRCCVTFHEKISYNKLFIRETVDNGKVRSVLGPVLLSMLTGTPIVLDEIDHGDVFVQSLMHEILDKRRVFIPELAMSIVAEKGCEFIATGNSLTDDSGQYHGDVGTALRTRFAAIHVEYPDEGVEAETVATASGCDKSTAATIAKVFKALRNAVAEQKLAGPISVRESCAAGLLFVQAKIDKLADDQAMGLGLGLMVVQKRPPGEQLVAAEICATVAKVAVGTFQSKVQAAGKKAAQAKP